MKKVTGEESEECIFKMRAKLYRVRDEQLKERGTGNARLMRHKETKKIRFIMRQEKTLKPVANFLCNKLTYLLLNSTRVSTLRVSEHEEQ